MNASVNIDRPKIILDNGGGLIKGGILPSYSQMNQEGGIFQNIEPKFLVPNCVGQIRRKNTLYISDSCYSISEYFCHRPHTDGLLMDLEMETKIWEKLFSSRHFTGGKINDMAICVTESFLTPAYIRQGVIELLFEYFNFEQVLIVASQTMLPFAYIGLNLGQYDILNPPIFKRKPETASEIQKGRRPVGRPPGRPRKIKTLIKTEEPDENQMGSFDIKQNHTIDVSELNWEESSKAYYGSSTLLTNRQLFIKGIECYNKYSHELYMKKIYNGENWQKFYFHSFFKINDFEENQNLLNEKKQIIHESNLTPVQESIDTLQPNNYLGNTYYLQDPNFLIPDKIELYKNFYDLNIRSIESFTKYFTNSYIEEFYKSRINGNYNLSLRNPCALFVDVGFSHTYVLPYIEYKLVEYAVLRTKVSSSMLNNQLKNVLSFRNKNLEHNELLVQNIKEKACYVSLDYLEDLRKEEKRVQQVKKHKIEKKLEERKKILDKELQEEREKKEMKKNNTLVETKEKKEDIEEKEIVEDFEKDKKKTKEMKEHIYYDYQLIDYSNINKHEINEVFDSIKENGSNQCIYVESDYDDTLPFSNVKKEDHSLLNNIQLKRQNAEEQTLRITNERISIPEILFNPKDANIEHCSIVELIYRSVCLLPKEIQKYFVSQIYVSGGATKFKNFKQRLYKELRSVFPSDWDINIYSHKNGLYSNYIGTHVWLSDENIYRYNVITRHDYFNHGKVN